MMYAEYNEIDGAEAAVALVCAATQTFNVGQIR
jgi:hypothetical protein